MQKRTSFALAATLAFSFSCLIPSFARAAGPDGENAANGPPAADLFEVGQRNVAAIADFGFYSGTGAGLSLTPNALSYSRALVHEITAGRPRTSFTLPDGRAIVRDGAQREAEDDGIE